MNKHFLTLKINQCNNATMKITLKVIKDVCKSLPPAEATPKN